MKGSSAIARAISDLAVKAMFGLAGDGNLAILHALRAETDVRYIPASHEASAVAMADAHARITNSTGLASVTHGPGLTNALTALTEAARARTPLVVLTGSIPEANRHHLQRIDQVAVVEPSGAAYRIPGEDEPLSVALRRAFDSAHNERRPVVLAIPTDVADLEMEYVSVSRQVAPPVVPDDDELDRALGVIETSRRPLVLAGRGAVASGAHDAILALADHLGATLGTTLPAQGFFGKASRSVGVVGSLSTQRALDSIAAADCVVSFGASLGPYTTFRGDLFKGKAVVQCDTDPRQIGRHLPIDGRLVGDAGATAGILRTWLLEAGRTARSPWDVSADVPSVAYHQVDSALGTLLERINRILPAERTAVFDVGRFMGESLKYISAPDPAGFVLFCNFAAIGLGMAGAVGAAIARPDRTSVAVVGDGGFKLGGLAEFHTAVSLGVDLIALVVNDGAYGTEYVQLVDSGRDPSIALLDVPSFADVATALGGNGVTVTDAADLELVEDAIRTGRRPLLIDLLIDPADVPAPPRMSKLADVADHRPSVSEAISGSRPRPTSTDLSAGPS